MNEIERMPDWKTKRIDEIKESLIFWSNENKFHRECYVVATLLLSLDEPFDDSELVPGKEPVDVQFKDCNFQVKEVMRAGRKRYDEYVQALERAKKAVRYADLLIEYTPKNLPLKEIVERSVQRSVDLRNKYGPNERKSMDLVCYVNFHEHEEVYSTFNLPRDLYFRSLSVVSNSYVVVLYASKEAPTFLQENTGLRFRAIHPDHS